MKAPEAVIFDMDGVIFDSERLYMQCCKEAAEIYGAENIEDTVMKCIGVNTENTLRIYREAYGEDFPLDDFWHEATSRFAQKAHGGLLPVKNGAEEILSYLHEKKIPVALASSTKTETVIRELKAAGLYGYFDIIVGGDMVSVSKPRPDIFLLAMEKLGRKPEECTIIEDSYNGVRAARAAGAYVIMVPDIAQPDDEMKALADIILSSLVEVKNKAFDESGIPLRL